MIRRGRHRLICVECGDEFYGRKGTQYCDDPCVDRATNRRAAERIKPLKPDLDAMKKAYKVLNGLIGDSNRIRVTKNKFEKALHFEYPTKRFILDGRKIVRIGDIEFAYNQEAKMYFITKRASNEK
jgi:hypothetical protein